MNSIKLLLVEDDDEFRELLARRFMRRGMQVAGVAEPRMALEAASSQQFHAAVLDRSLPGMDGLELLQRLKAVDAQLKVILLSGSADSEGPTLARDYGAFAYLAKPCGLAELEAIIEAAVGRTARQ